MIEPDLLSCSVVDGQPICCIVDPLHLDSSAVGVSPVNLALPPCSPYWGTRREENEVAVTPPCVLAAQILEHPCMLAINAVSQQSQHAHCGREFPTEASDGFPPFKRTCTEASWSCGLASSSSSVPCAGSPSSSSDHLPDADPLTQLNPQHYCTGYDAFVSHEPCMMCVALLPFLTQTICVFVLSSGA